MNTSRAIVLVLLCGLLPLFLHADEDSLAQVRDDFERLAENSLAEKGLAENSRAELKSLGHRALDLARKSTRNRDIYSAMTLLATLVAEGPAETARPLRAAAMEILVSRFHDSRRWAIFVGEQFQPDPRHLPESAWNEEVAAYDALLDDLRAGTKNPRVAAELGYAKALLRVRLHQSGRWLEEPERKQTLALLGEISRTSGELPRPGGAGVTLGQEIERCIADLNTLYRGAQAPATVGVDLQGKLISLADYRGQIVIVDFWSTFCAPCLALVPGSLQLLEKYQGHPVVMLGVNGDQTREMGMATAERVGMTWRSLWDGAEGPAGPLAAAWMVQSWPTVFVIDGDGHVRYRFVGKPSVDEGLEEAVRSLLADM